MNQTRSNVSIISEPRQSPLAPRLSLLIGTRNRPVELKRALDSVLAQDFEGLEILVLDDASDETSWHQSIVDAFGQTNFYFYRSESSLGVAGGRNFLMGKANGLYLFVLDDDAVLLGSSNFSDVVHTFEADTKVGAVSGLVYDHRDGLTRILAPFPAQYKKTGSKMLEQKRQASYFVGGLHAVRKSALAVCGHYAPYLFYGEEELDLSYRLIEAEFTIVFEPKITADHFPAKPVVQQGQINQELSFHVSNRIVMAYNYLPIVYCPTYLVVWLSRYFIRCVREKSLSSFFRGLVLAKSNLAGIGRKPFSKATISYLKNNYGRLWY